MMKTKLSARIIVFLSISTFISFGLYHLTKFETVDEHFWKDERIKQYWQGIAKRDWKKTYINDKPGITTAIISGLGLMFEPNPQDNKNRNHQESELFNIYNLEKVSKINLAFRLPLLIFNGLFLLYFFWIIKKLTQSDLIAAFTTMFLGFSSILIGISQIINPDTLLWTFSGAALFTFFALLKKQEKKILFLTALFTGLSLLSKYTANILFPLYLLIIFLNLIFHFENFDSPKLVKDYIFKQLFNFAIILAGSLLTYALLLPASFVKFKYFYRGTIGFPAFRLLLLPVMIFLALIAIDIIFFKSRILHALISKIAKFKNAITNTAIIIPLLFFLFIIINCFSNQSLLSLDHLRSVAMEDDNLTFQGLLNHDFILIKLLKIISIELYPFVFSLSLIMLLVILVSWIKYLFEKSKKFELYIVTISIFSIIYYLALYFSGVLSNARYSIMLYPLFSFLGAIGLWHLMESLKSIKIKYFLIGLMLIIQFVSLWKIKPFYFNYTNSLLTHEFSIHDSWGYGQYEAAQYLNSLPNATNLQIWADRSGICQFFIGKCIRNYKIDLSRTKPDYFVISSRGQARHPFEWKNSSLAKQSNFYYYKKDPQWSLSIEDRPSNFIKVIESEE